VAVVVHQAPGVAQPVELPDYVGEDVQKSMSIGIAVEEVFAPLDFLA